MPSRRNTICQAKALTTAPTDSGRMMETSITICSTAPARASAKAAGYPITKQTTVTQAATRSVLPTTRQLNGSLRKAT